MIFFMTIFKMRTLYSFSFLPAMTQLKTIFVINILFQTTVSAGTHSLWYYHTFTMKGTESSEFIVVGKVDDIILESLTSEQEFSRYWNVSSDTDDNVYSRKYHALGAKKKMKQHIQRIMPHFNHTGFHTLQRLAGCELDDDGTGRVGVWEAYDGEQFLDKSDGSGSWSFPTIQRKIEKFSGDLMATITVQLFLNECLDLLKIYVTEGKNILNRKQKPKTRILYKDRDVGKKVTCLATGFYPRHINMTLLRDGQPVPLEQLEEGDVLPNGDGTYQQKKSVIVSSDEEKKKQDYRCIVNHVSLDNKLDITWVFVPDPKDNRYRILGVLVGTAFLILIFAIGRQIWRQRQQIL